MAEQKSTKLDRKQDLHVPYQVCVFRADRKNKMAALASAWLKHFRLLLWDRWTEFNETWQEARFQHPLPSFVFFRADQKNKMATLASDWLRHFRLLLWTCWTDSMKLDRKQDFNILYQVLCFLGRSEKQDGRPGLWLAETFSASPLNLLNRFIETSQEARCQHPLPSLCFLGQSEKQDGRPGLWLAETFSTNPLKRLNGIQRNLTGSKISTFSNNFVFVGLISKQKGWQIVLRCMICDPLGLLLDFV